MVIKLTIYMLLLLALAGCSSNQKSDDFSYQMVPAVNQAEYKNTLSRYSKKDEQYDGFSNLYHATVTLLNSEVTSIVLQQKGHFLQWNPAQAREHRQKEMQSFSSKSHLMLSLYTAERGNNDLIRPESMWKIYLIYKEQRYLGRVKKFPGSFSQIIRLFPYHNRFSKLYRVEFDAPMAIVEKEASEIILTSSLGQSRFKFSSVQ